jgi:hypothetical protein
MRISELKTYYYNKGNNNNFWNNIPNVREDFENYLPIPIHTIRMYVRKRMIDLWFL